MTSRELRRCIRDLVALSTLPAIWTSYNPRQIADSMAAALLSMLAADFVHITLPSDNSEPPVETIHVKTSIGSDEEKMIFRDLARYVARTMRTNGRHRQPV